MPEVSLLCIKPEDMNLTDTFSDLGPCQTLDSSFLINIYTEIAY